MNSSIEKDEAQARRAAELLKAMAHPVRLRILAILCESPENVSRLAERLGVSQPIVSQQLRILRLSNLVGVTREGGLAHYRLLAPRLRDMMRCIEGCQPTGGNDA